MSADWLALAPVLPSVELMRLDLSLGWALVLALLGALALPRAGLPLRRALALLLALWGLVPGAASPTHWLGLAFQTPSLSSQLLCMVLLWQRLGGSPGTLWHGARCSRSFWSWLGLCVGAVLLLDTFAQLPLQVYRSGFDTLAVLYLALALLLPWSWRGGRPAAPTLLLGSVLLLFVCTRLPSGNLWDALMDPWLWLVLLVLRLQALWRRFRPAAAATRD